jgi:hypothetical protein
VLARLVSPLFLFVFVVAASALDPVPEAPTLPASAPRTSSARSNTESAWHTAAAKAVAPHAVAQASSDASWPAGADPLGPYEPAVIDRVWELPARPGFPGARGVEGHATHRAPCEAARRDLKIMTFTLGTAATTVVW